MITYTVSRGATSSVGATLKGSHTEAGTSEINLDSQYAASSSNVSLAAAFDVADIQAVILLSDQNLTLETNSGGSPDDTISLIAGVPLEWSRSAGYFPCPFTVDVTGLFVTCTPAARLRGKILLA